MKCKYTRCCSNTKCGVDSASEYCDQHRKKVCVSCRSQATNECDYCGQFVCGAPLCDNCTGTGSGGSWGFLEHTHVAKVEEPTNDAKDKMFFRLS